MSDWDKTRNGKEMMETIIRYLPRITVCLEEIAKELGKHDEFGRSEGEKRILRFLKDNKKATTESKKILYTEIKDTKMSYVLTEDIAKIGKKLTETEEFPIHDGSKIAYNFGYKKYKEETTEQERK